jgi:hypothetical protein
VGHFKSRMNRMEKKPNRVTRKMVNDALGARGRNESLREGEVFFISAVAKP